MRRDLTLSIDVGTGNVRAALVDADGRIAATMAREHERIVPSFGWAEQRAADWWTGACEAVRRVLGSVENGAARVSCVAACGQMHGTVLVDADGEPTRATVPLGNDERTAGLVSEFEKRHAAEAYLPLTGNPATPAWPAFKLQWLRSEDAAAYERATHVLMPKDFVNLRLTGERAMDSGDASCSFLMNPDTRAWSSHMTERLGIDPALLPPIREPAEILGSVTPAAARDTGLAPGTPVIVGGADHPVALLGSGVCRPGLASDDTGTSCTLTLIAERPLLDPEICNVATPDGRWGAFVLLETGGDALRWARQAFHEGALSFSESVERAAQAPAGADGLFFMPYLTGERLGHHRNARAGFLGLTAGHGSAHLYRAVMEGVAFAAARHLGIMEKAAGTRLERVVARGEAAKVPLWLRIKASLYDMPIVVPQEAEAAVVGCAILANVATGRFPDPASGADRFVRFAEEVAPDPAWAERYDRMQPVFNRIHSNGWDYYDELDRLAAN